MCMSATSASCVAGLTPPSIREGSYKDMLAFRETPVALLIRLRLKRCARNITARKYQATPYFEVHLDFAGARRRVVRSWSEWVS